MKPAFSFVEVIISVFILSYLGVAILKFNSFNKNGMRYNIEKQSKLMIYTALLYTNDAVEDNKLYRLNDLVTFNNLTDEDSRFLKNIQLKSTKDNVESFFLYNDGKEDFFIDSGDLSIKYNDNRNLNFIYVQRPL